VVVTWIAGALDGARNAHPRHQGSSASLWAIGSVVGAIVVVQFAWNDVRRLTDHSWWLELPGLVLLVVSTVFAIWARLSLGRMWSASPNVLQEHHELRTDGPYAITRHPSHTGLLGMLLGTALLNGLGVSLAILFVTPFFLASVGALGSLELGGQSEAGEDLGSDERRDLFDKRTLEREDVDRQR